MRHHPLSAIAHALDAFDGEMESLRRDLHDGVRAAVFDEESLLHPVGSDGDRRTVVTDPQQHSAVTSILKYFEYDHLPEEQARISAHLGAVAHAMAATLSGPELTAGLRKLLEAKDCFVRASLGR